MLVNGEQVEQHLGKEMFTTTEATNFMEISKSLIYKMTFRRDIPVYKSTGGRVYIKKSDILDYLQRNRITSNDETERQAINYVINHQPKRKAYRQQKNEFYSSSD